MIARHSRVFFSCECCGASEALGERFKFCAMCEDELRASNLASWELEKAASKAQDDLLAAQRIEQQARWRQQLSAARVAVRQLTEVFERLGIVLVIPAELVPQVFELKLREFDMTPDLRSVLKERSITIAGKKCTWGLESSVAINVRFDLVQQQRLLDMWRICQGAGWTQDQFDMLLTAHIRAALVQCDEELANLLIVAGFQRCGKKDGQTKRFVPADMPPLRALVMTPDARRRMSGLPVALWLGGQGPDNSLLSAHGSFQNIEQDSKSVGIAAAKKTGTRGCGGYPEAGGATCSLRLISRRTLRSRYA